VKPPRVGGEDLAEPLGPEPQCLRPEVRQLRLGLLGRQQPDAGPLLRAGLRQDQLGAVLEAEPERR
jgi:hypothetical protein